MKTTIHNHERLYNYDFEVSNVGIIGVYGISGSGKSSLLDAIAGYDNNAKGSIYFNNATLNGIHQCSYMNQHPILFTHWTIRENLDFVHNYHSKPYDEYIKKLNCVKLLDKYPNELSGGEKQRIIFIRTMIQISDKSLVLLDEPFTALDINIRKAAINILKQQSNCLIFLVTHDINEIYQIADEFLYIKDGTVEYQNTITNAMVSGINGLPVASKLTIDNIKHVILADDVSISLEQNHTSSIQHQLECTITTINLNKGICLIELMHIQSKQKLYAKITSESQTKLNLQCNDNVIANFKALRN